MSLGMPVQMTASLSSMDIRVKETLDAWLKYGTVYLIYRVLSFYFMEQNGNAELFDAESLQIILYILIGFTIYFLVVKPYIPVNLQHPILRNIANDSLMFGTVLLSSHLLDVWMGGADMFNAEWLSTSGIILVSFAAYQVFLNPFIPTDKLSVVVKPIADDWLKFGTMLVVARVLQGRSITDENWMSSVGFILVGFAGYNLVTKQLLN